MKIEKKDLGTIQKKKPVRIFHEDGIKSYSNKSNFPQIMELFQIFPKYLATYNGKRFLMILKSYKKKKSLM